jgi:hypothetical protein
MPGLSFCIEFCWADEWPPVAENVSLRRLRSGHGHPTGKQDPRRAGEPPFAEPGVEAGLVAQAPPRERPQAAPRGVSHGRGNVAPPVRSHRGRFKPALRPDAEGLPDRLERQGKHRVGRAQEMGDPAAALMLPPHCRAREAGDVPKPRALCQPGSFTQRVAIGRSLSKAMAGVRR